MSQAGFGDSSSQEGTSQEFIESQSPPQIAQQMSFPNAVADSTTLFNALPRQVLEQELQFCNERSQQAQVLLRQAQEQLQLSQLVIQRQETLTQTLQARIDQLERELQDVHSSGEELRDRLKRQQHHTSQLKAALERCLDTSSTKDIAPNDLGMPNLESWSIAKLADEKITPVEQINSSPLQNVVKITPAPQPIEMSSVLGFEQGIDTSSSDDQIRQPEAIDVPLPLSPKMQPISPLIVRTHKAAQGSPIALNLLNTQPSLPIANPSQSPSQSNDASNASPSNDSIGVREFSLRDLQAKTQLEPPYKNQYETQYESQIPIETQQVDQQELNTDDDSMTRYRHDSPISSTSATNSARTSQVVAPKFIRALYGYGSVESHEPPTELAIANPTVSSNRQAVKTLAAVQLPQFPPLPRR